MRKYILICILSVIVINSFAQDSHKTIDSLNVTMLERIESLESYIMKMKQDLLNTNGRVARTKLEISNIKETVSKVENKSQTNEHAIIQLEESILLKLNETTTSFQKGQNSLSMSISHMTLVGCLITILLVLFATVIYILLRRKIVNGASSIESIRNAQKNLQEESLKLDNKLIELLDSQLKLHTGNMSKKINEEIDHSLALKVADELTRIETNLYRMDKTVRGYKQLSASLRRIKDNYLANGYEIVDMLGMPYNDGMKVIANFIPDENLKEGEQIITAIVKPQINYKGIMIQAAQITVSQN